MSAAAELLRFFRYLALRSVALAPARDLFLDEKFHRIRQHYGADCLDVGSGYGNFAQFLRANGIATTMIDVVDEGRHPEHKTLLFDGRTIPFPNKSFDTAIAMFVLHHAQDQRTLLAEIGRVTRHRVIVAEDVMETGLDRLLGSIHLKTSIWSEARDSFHPDAEWRKIFAGLGWHLLETVAISPCKAPFYPVSRRVYVLAPASD